MRALDTNVLVRLIVRDEPRQTASAEAFVEGGAWVSLVALVESIWVLKSTYGLPAGELIKTLESVLDNGRLVLQEPATVMAALDRFRRQPALGFADCLVLELARKAGHLPLGTFDRALGRVHGAQKL
jgi:predicted nucleic-acid-binding protein